MENRQNLIDVFVKYNAQLNLSAIREPDDIYTKHVLDSLELNKFFQFEPGKSIADVGTGGGFPLLPLAISNPENRFTGIDARQKKVKAVNSMIEELGITNAKCRRSRIEEYNDKFDYVTARAVAYIDKLWDRSKHLLRKDGKLILYKPVSYDEKDDIINICYNE